MGEDILTRIVNRKKEELLSAQKARPEKEVKREALAVQGHRPFLENLKRYSGPSTVNIIAEIKRASPSKGDIGMGLDAGLIAHEYEAGGAQALSVLTDTDFFKGSFDDFRLARKNTTLPMLRKDFLVSEYQIYESRVLGADAVLLIARILGKEELKAYLEMALGLSMDALVEIHSEEDLEKTLYAGATLIGINNRNLSSFDTNLETAIRFKAMLTPDQVAVAASGISGRDDILRNQKAGIFNFLIGESVVRAKDRAGFLKTLRGEA